MNGHVADQRALALRVRWREREECWHRTAADQGTPKLDSDHRCRLHDLSKGEPSNPHDLPKR